MTPTRPEPWYGPNQSCTLAHFDGAGNPAPCPDSLHIEPERVESVLPPLSVGCARAAIMAALSVFWTGVILLAIALAAPRSPAVSPPVSEAGQADQRATGAPHVPSGSQSAGVRGQSADDWYLVLRGYPSGAPSPAVGLHPAPGGQAVGLTEPLAGSSPATAHNARSMPALSGWATWCAPTANQCQRWGGDARLGAVPSFRWGDAPYPVRVTYGGRSTIVQIVSFCACGDRHGEPTVVDLSPAAFKELAPLSRGVIRVEVQRLDRIALPETGTR